MPTTSRLPIAIGELHLVERGRRDAPTVVLVHGYPDTSRLWDGVADRLATDHHVVAYDVRGAGASSAPADADGYRLEHLLDDLAAVIDATGGGDPVHLVGHDWGAIQGFEAVLTPAVARRVASFTALSGPGLETSRWWLRTRLQRPSLGSLRDVVAQAARSWYVGAFQVPVVSDLVVRRAAAPALRRGGHPDPPPTVVEDAVRGLGLYRANRAEGRLRDPVGSLPAGVSVRVVIGRDDRYVSPRVFDDLRDRLGVPVVEVEAGHWLPVAVPDVVAAHVREHVAAVEHGGGTATGARRGARRTRR